MIGRHYCALFDSAYLPQGLALYESLDKHSSEEFTFAVLALDDECATQFQSLGIKNACVVGRRAFENDQRLENIKKQRTRQEYAWTCASNLLEWLLLCPDCGIDELTYLDADMMFFDDPEVIFDEIGDRSVAITPHRLIPAKKYLEATSGTYNVGLIHFKNTKTGRACLEWWSEQVRGRCSAKSGGDQKYLNDFVPLFGSDVCVIENIGVNAGPWSVGNWTVTDGPCLDGHPLIAYHFHEYKHGVRLTNYALRESDKEIIYKPYSAAIDAAIASLNRHTPVHTFQSDSRC